MREVNFSIPNVNKASVGITTALYDRRALDCTSTLPLINSLNHLAYLTTSSARIRDILTVDGGVERLVCILKAGRSREMMEMWKWNLAFQCIVNIGVRGSEKVRTRVVEADVVPVIATILDNYIQVIDKCREKAEAEASLRRRTLHSLTPCTLSHHSRGSSRGSCPQQTPQQASSSMSEHRSFRRHDPPPSILIPQPSSQNTIATTSDQQRPSSLSNGPAADMLPISPQRPQISPIDQRALSRAHHVHHHHHHHHRHAHHRSQDSRYHGHPGFNTGSRHVPRQSSPAAVPPMDSQDGIGIQPVRDTERLLSTLPALHTGISSQPESPTTPNPHTISSISQELHENLRRPSVRQRHSTSGDSDDANGDEAASEASGNNDNLDEPMVDIQPEVGIQGNEDPDSMLEDVRMTTDLGLNPPNDSEGQEREVFNLNHQSANDGSIINASITPPANNATFPPQAQQMQAAQITNHSLSQNTHTSYLFDRSAPPGVLAATPRDEDVLMSLQLLAYVSKYCNLRSYFQKSHLVPKLKIGDKLKALDEVKTEPTERDPLEDEEYLLPDDFNIFPLVERFTVRHHCTDMQHWAGVVMRNLCRKDDTRGGIRQCAYYECGKWEQWPRQFAKCRRCRRTKYCSKDCQKNAWVSLAKSRIKLAL